LATWSSRSWGGRSCGHGGGVSLSWDSAGTDLVAPFLVAALILGGLSRVFAVKFALTSLVVLSKVTLEFLRFTIISTSFSFGID
jgi:hypothetical protein